MSRLLYCWNALAPSAALLKITDATPFDLPLLSYVRLTLRMGPTVCVNSSYIQCQSIL
jgi:hypothetical protein